jgi:hypothetical protein
LSDLESRKKQGRPWTENTSTTKNTKKIINSNDLHGAEPPSLDVISRVESHPHDLVGCNSELENKKTNH